LLEPGALINFDTAELQLLIRPAGFYTQKAMRLQCFSQWLLDHGDFTGLERMPLKILRECLLSLSGIGPETADCILLYACKRPVFVIDTYTRRFVKVLGYDESSMTYDRLQQLFVDALPCDVALYNEYHALIVAYGKSHFQKASHRGMLPEMLTGDRVRDEEDDVPIWRGMYDK